MSKQQKAKAIARRAGKTASSSSRVIGKHTAAGARKVAHHSTKAYHVAHHHVAHRPHTFFMENWAWYAKWHAWPKHRIVHHLGLGLYSLVIGVMVFNSIRVAFAADLTNNWDFGTPSDFSFDGGVEADGTSARLKAQEYAADGNTAALFNMNETSGTTFNDSSANNNDGTTTGSPSFSAGRMNNGLGLNGTSQYGSASDSASLSVTGQQSVEAWIKPSTTFNDDSTQSQTIVDKGSYQLGLDRTNGKVTYEIENGESEQWTKRLGDGQSGSWDLNHASVEASTPYGTDIYVGTGYTRGDAEVWKWNGSSWSKIGGDGMNSSWADQTYEVVSSIATNGTALYAGLGNTAGDAEVWTCELSTNCASWSKIGGDGTGITSGGSVVNVLRVHSGSLYAGVGGSAGFGDVFRYDGGTTWTQIGGDGLNSGWAASTFEEVTSLATDGTDLYAGIGVSTTDAEVWKWNGSSWSKIGGDGVSSSWNTNYEAVESLTAFGGNVYAGLGRTNNVNDGEVWRYNGTSWTQIGGDSVNSSWSAIVYNQAFALTNDGTNLYVGLGQGTNAGAVWRWNGTTWTQIGGSPVSSTFQSFHIKTMFYNNSKLHVGMSAATVSQGYATGGTFWDYDGTTWTALGGGYKNNSWGGWGLGRVTSSTVLGSKAYFGLGSSPNSAFVYEYDGTTATRIGGSGLNGSWPEWVYEEVLAMIAYKGELYVGLGNGVGDGDVWKYDGTSWSQVGGDGVNSSWNNSENIVYSMAVFNGNLYVGLGYDAYEGDIWQWDGNNWTLVAGGPGNGAAVNGSWSLTGRGIESMLVYNGQLCAGFGGIGGTAQVWCWSGSGNWTQIADNAGSNGSWSSFATVMSMAVYKDKLYAGVSTTAGHKSTVWEYNGTSWSQIAGTDINNTWSDGTYSYARSLTVYNAKLYFSVGYTGSSNPTGDVWRYDGTSWSQVGGDGINNSWATASSIEEVATMVVYKGKLYAGLGFSANADALVYSFGNNGYLESTTSAFSTDWRHIAATYNGVTMKIYINGVEDASRNVSVSGVDTNDQLRIGSGFGSSRAGDGQQFFSGMIDEVRISNTARTSFNSKPFSDAAQAVTLAAAVRKTGIDSWDGFASSETPNGGTITYRLSADEGDTWQYWSGGAWTASSNLSESNDIATINTNIGSFSVGFGGILWQAVLQGDGTEQVTLNSVTLTANSDNVEPDANATALQGYKSNGGASLASNAWTNGGSPYFSWTAGTDSGSGILGYCLYLGQTSSADPVTTKGLLGTGPVNTGSNCQFAVSGNTLDLATSGLLGTALTSSNDPYYLNVKAIDNAGNVYSGASAQFQFRFDNTAPSNPAYITAPSSFINTKTATLTWPTSGGGAPADANAGLAGLQYRIGNTTWYGDSHSGTGDANDLLSNDGTYTTVDPPDFDNIADGVNTVYFRTWDQAGNVTTSYVTAALKINTTGAPTEPQNLSVDPTTNTTNLFTFEWQAPTTFNTTTGLENKLSYCYTINTLPSANTCTFSADGDTNVTGAFATQPGSNTFYVVARDDFGAINYSSFSNITFTANTPAPGIPTNIDIADVSVKSSNNWRLAITWDEPTIVGAGVSSYKVFRSTDNNTFTQVGSSTSTSYIDTGLTQVEYYYRVKACDSANNCGAETSVVSETPTGKFTTAANLTSEPTVSNVTTKRAKITWSTDRASDSKVAIGTTSGEYSPSEVGNSDQVTAHSLDLDNLAAGTTYYFVAKWTDEDGNTGTSQEYTFTTAPAPLLKEVNTLLVGLATATVQFTVKDAAKIEINYGKSDSFGGVKSLNTSTTESTYEVELNGLDDGTKYLYRITMYDTEGGRYESSIFSLTTPPRPKISDLRFQPVEGEPTSTQRVTWTTNVATNSILTYGKVDTSGTTDQNAELKTQHEVVIRSLEDESEYFLVAQGRDTNGNLAVSDRQVFKTALDTRPPKITDIVIEPTVRGAGAEARGQIVVSWRTDEPSTSQVAFAEGSNVQTFNNRTAEDGELTTEHLVIVSDLPPGKVYSISPQSRDKAGNLTSAESQAAIIGRASESVLNIVLNTLRKVFGL